MKRVFSGIQPTGIVHIGNYLGAIRQFIKLQEEAECFYSIVDLHAITLPQEPGKLAKNILETAVSYLALGVDPQKATIFVQSQVPAHSELAWILACLTPLSELKQMHQYKEKAKKQGRDVNTGLLMYPVLMASDILLYDTDIVPVGEDQIQHLELARTLARKFNNRYGTKSFKVPKPLIRQETARIMSLQNPKKKMSKSGSPKGFIGLFEAPGEIKKKIRLAMTDSGREIKMSSSKPAISNLIRIYSAFAGKSASQTEELFAGKSYSDFKNSLAELLCEKLSSFRRRRKKLEGNIDYVKDILEKGRRKAQDVAEKKLAQVKKIVGLGV